MSYWVPDRNSIIMTIDEREIPMDPSWVKQINIISSFTNFLPLIELNLFDRGGILSEALAVSGGESLGIQYAVQREELNEEPFDFILGTVQEDNLKPGAVQGNFIQLRGMLGFSDLMFRPQRNRAFLDKKSSEVFQELADEMGAKTFIEESEDKQTWLQAHWTNAQMIRHIAGRAVKEDDTGAYFYGTDKDGRMIFYTGNGLYDQEVTRRYTFSNNPDEFDEEKNRRDNAKLTKNEILYDFQISVKKEFAGTSGGYGISWQHFVWDEKKYDETPFEPSKLLRSELSDRTVIKPEEEDAETRFMHHGRVDENHHEKILEARGYNEVWRRVGSALKLSIIVRGDNTLRIGEKVEVHIPTVPNEKLNADYVDGEWIIERVIDVLTRYGYYTKLVLTRDGLNYGDEGT